MIKCCKSTTSCAKLLQNGEHRENYLCLGCGMWGMGICGGEGRDEGAMGKKGGLKGQCDEISTHQFLIAELTLLRKNL